MAESFDFIFLDFLTIFHIQEHTKDGTFVTPTHAYYIIKVIPKLSFWGKYKNSIAQKHDFFFLFTTTYYILVYSTTHSTYSLRVSPLWRWKIYFRKCFRWLKECFLHWWKIVFLCKIQSPSVLCVGIWLFYNLTFVRNLLDFEKLYSNLK